MRPQYNSLKYKNYTFTHDSEAADLNARKTKFTNDVLYKFENKVKDKVRKLSYPYLVTHKGNKQSSSPMKWKNNYGLDIDIDMINKSFQLIMKMKLQNDHKVCIIRHVHQSFMKVQSLKKIKRMDTIHCPQCGSIIDSFEHPLFSCYLPMFIWNLVICHINQTFNTYLEPSVLTALLPNKNSLKIPSLNDTDKNDILSLITNCLSYLVSNFY